MELLLKTKSMKEFINPFDFEQISDSQDLLLNKISIETRCPMASINVAFLFLNIDEN